MGIDRAGVWEGMGMNGYVCVVFFFIIIIP